ncbi:hypothetical protein B0H17DRAFT_1138968 [Mycena rosella]|uniref:Uncharacterized protein n=1 Tax=Mycena rosella TaxID=1033263 RepID=A0AAD7D5S7_MYCRO|nr:hypothetical protein B0H17DRAFT_1138968 [Mycena rosella]
MQRVLFDSKLGTTFRSSTTDAEATPAAPRCSAPGCRDLSSPNIVAEYAVVTQSHGLGAQNDIITRTQTCQYSGFVPRFVEHAEGNIEGRQGQSKIENSEDRSATFSANSLQDDIPDEHCKKYLVLLPVFYANIDPYRAGEQLGIPSTFARGAGERALISLAAIFSMVLRVSIPPAVFPEVWGSAYRWTDDRATGAGFLHFISTFGGNLVSSAPGFRRMLSRAWIMVLRTPNTLRRPIGLCALSDVLFGDSRRLSREPVSVLASLVVQYLDEFSPGCDNLSLRRDSRLRGTIFDFVDDIARFLGPAELDGTNSGAFSRVLLSAGIIKSTIIMAKALTKPDPESETPAFAPLVDKSLAFLNRMLLTTPGNCLISDAVQEGLLDLILVCGAARKFPKTMKSLLDGVLLIPLIYYYDMRILGKILDTDQRANTKAFNASGLFSTWAHFIALAKERLEILR